VATPSCCHQVTRPRSCCRSSPVSKTASRFVSKTRYRKAISSSLMPTPSRFTVSANTSCRMPARSHAPTDRTLVLIVACRIGHLARLCSSWSSRCSRVPPCFFIVFLLFFYCCFKLSLPRYAHHPTSLKPARLLLVLFGMAKRTLGPYLAAMHRILISALPACAAAPWPLSMQACKDGRTGPAGAPMASGSRLSTEQLVAPSAQLPVLTFRIGNYLDPIWRS
jgi:hypothetical protein